MSQEFSDFYEQWFDRVYTYARHRTGSPTRADEIASDTFSRVLKNWETFDPAKADRRTWLFYIAFRAVADNYRAQRAGVVQGLELAAEPQERGLGPPGEAERAQERRDLAAALAALDDKAREIVALRFYAGMTNRAIAKLLDLTESSVAVTLFRSVRRMRKNFTGVEADHG